MATRYATPPTDPVPPGVVRPPNGVGTPMPRAGGAPDWIIFAGGLIIALGITEVFYAWKPGAGYAFAAIVVLGYLASGDRLDKVMAWLTHIGWVQ